MPMVVVVVVVVGRRLLLASRAIHLSLASSTTTQAPHPLSLPLLYSRV